MTKILLLLAFTATTASAMSSLEPIAHGPLDFMFARSALSLPQLTQLLPTRFEQAIARKLVENIERIFDEHKERDVPLNLFTLPFELQTSILARLNFKDLARLACVSRAHNKLVKDYTFSVKKLDLSEVKGGVSYRFMNWLSVYFPNIEHLILRPHNNYSYSYRHVVSYIRNPTFLEELLLRRPPIFQKLNYLELRGFDEQDFVRLDQQIGRVDRDSLSKRYAEGLKVLLLWKGQNTNNKVKIVTPSSSYHLE